MIYRDKRRQGRRELGQIRPTGMRAAWPQKKHFNQTRQVGSLLFYRIKKGKGPAQGP
jgi:hypothetical protein